ncbi:alpha-hydroxy-acid oxidizing protein [Kitasatospora sp. NPDC101801]|uniref:alpha-hydroxy-acid oxidizing protein n=1 Tax=Kitasatospora sp. NPDC101801 TaxID=3364103 RepID=UPI003826F76E
MGPLTLRETGEDARGRLPVAVRESVDRGSDRERTPAADLSRYGRWGFRPRTLVDVSAPDLTVDLLGSTLAAPIAMFSGRTSEEIAAEATGPLRLQRYSLRRRDALAGLVRRAEQVGRRALVPGLLRDEPEHTPALLGRPRPGEPDRSALAEFGG